MIVVFLPMGLIAARILTDSKWRHNGQEIENMIAEYPPTLLAEVKEKTKNRQLTGFTPGQGPLNPDLMLVGEAPGRHEEKVNIPFSGASGQELMKLIESI